MSPSPGQPRADAPGTIGWRVLVVAIFVFFALLRLLWIGSEEVWFDEAMTWHYASQPWSEVADFVRTNDVHPPFFFLYTKLFLGFGDAPWALRLGSVILELAALPFIYWAAWMLAPNDKRRQVAMVAFLLAGLSGNAIFMAHLARAYSGMYLGFSVAFAALSWIVTHPEVASRPLYRQPVGGALGAFVLLAAGLAMLPWLHNLGLLYCAAIGGVSVLIWAVCLRASAGGLLNFIAAAALAAMLYLPNLPALISQLEPVNSDYWIPLPTLKGLVSLVLEVFGQSWTSLSPENPVGIALAGTVCLIGLASSIALARHRRVGALLVTALLPASVLVLFLAVTFLVKPVLLNRAVFPVLGPWFVLIAIGLAYLPWRGLRIGLCAALVVIFAASSLLRQPEAPWRSMALKTIVEDAAAIPTFMTVPNAAAVLLDYHARQQGYQIKTVPLPRPYPAKDASYYYATGWPGVPAVNAEALQTIDAALSEQAEDVWLFLRAYWIYDPDALLKPFLDKRFCYQPIDDAPRKLYMFVKLRPRSELASGGCVDMGDDEYFPYDRPAYGQFQLQGFAE